MSYMPKMKRLIRAGENDKAMNVLENGMKAIGEELRVFANRHPGDWPMVIASMKMMAEKMENSLSKEAKMGLALIGAMFDAEVRVSTAKITVDEAELKRQMEEAE